MSQLRVTIWNEYVHEQKSDAIRAIYPQGMHQAIAEGFADPSAYLIRTATLDEPEHGLTEEVLGSTDVLFWWGHTAHAKVSDEIVARVHKHVLQGMGIVFLHSAHGSKLFARLMGTTCTLKWREIHEHERIWVIEPNHPITRGLPEQFVLPHEEMYGERFDIPAPDELLMIGWFAGGEVFRCGCCWTRGRGRVFYFQPGHESFPTFYDPNVRLVLRNAACWAAAVGPRVPVDNFHQAEPFEDVKRQA